MKHQVKEPEKHELQPYERHLHAVTLVAGDWRRLFTEMEFKLLIAEALNTCSHIMGMRIAGYLITRRRICLVLKVHRKYLKMILERFQYVLFEIVIAACERRKRERFNSCGPEHEIVLAHLFRPFHLYNEHLILLLTGRKIKIPYYDHRLERMQAKLHNYPFCSVPDYVGAEGPVAIFKLERVGSNRY